MKPSSVTLATSLSAEERIILTGHSVPGEWSGMANTWKLDVSGADGEMSHCRMSTSHTLHFLRPVPSKKISASINIFSVNSNSGIMRSLSSSILLQKCFIFKCKQKARLATGLMSLGRAVGQLRILRSYTGRVQGTHPPVCR